MYFVFAFFFIFNLAHAQNNQFMNQLDMTDVVSILSNPAKELMGIDTTQTCRPVIFIDPDIHRGGCPTLKNSRPQSWNSSLLFSCLQYLRTKVGGESNPLDHDAILKNLYRLEPHEQELMGMVLTSYGEVRGADINEAYLVMKTLSNRVKTAKEKGCKHANALDAATQAWQFSVWNKNDPNWKKAISLELEEDNEEEKMKAILGVYKNYKAGTYTVNNQDKKTFDNITHFRTQNLTNVPDWGRAHNAIKTIRINGKDAGASGNMKVHHYFFKNIPWSFKYNNKRPQRKGEGACY